MHIGLLNASLFAASILPLSTSYVICEALGFESGIDRKFSEAKIFYGLYTAPLIALGAISSYFFWDAIRNAILLWSQVPEWIPAASSLHDFRFSYW